MSGATEREIAELLGHRTMAMVKRYSHLSKEHVAGLVERLEGALVGPPSARSRRRA
jgi:site-specific recombinase XerD